MLAIVDYGAGNLTSVRLGFEALGVPCIVTRDAATIRGARRVVFPGVGAAGSAMEALRRMGIEEVLREVAGGGTPFLGICLGTQIIFERSEEDGGVDCLGLLAGRVRLFQPADRRDKVPQMGWNAVRMQREHPVFAGVESDSEFYFVHSYYPSPALEGEVLGRTEYGGVGFASVVGRGNIVATQFHPEKSGRVGLRVLENFSRWDGRC